MSPKDQIEGLLPGLHGWCNPDKANALCDLVLKTKPKRICEIGTWGGKSLFPMAIPAKQNNNGCILIAIDPWSPEASAAGQTDPGSEKWWAEQNHEMVYQSFLYHLKKLGLESIVEVHREKSSTMQPPSDLDILHIDGNHGPEALEDAQRYAPNVKLGGYCILDDLGWSGGYVRMAEKFIKSIGFYPEKTTADWGIYRRVEMGTAKVAEQASDSRSPILSAEQQLDSKLTVAMVTSRKEPEMWWMLKSLFNSGLCPAQILIVSLHEQDLNKTVFSEETLAQIQKSKTNISIVSPKPTAWQGQHRLTAEDWWAVSNARNTAICLCKTDWLLLMDDRCVMMPGCADAIRDAMRDNYVVCGSYQKRVGMKVEDGFITDGGTIIGDDHRLLNHPSGLKNCPGEWSFGCIIGFPLAWALEVNGYEELMDGLSFEDCFFGRMLKNCGHQLNFDPRLRIIQDRTPDKSGPVMHRTSKERFPHDKEDKGHASITRFSPLKRTQHPWNLSEIRRAVLSGGEWPKVSEGPQTDWFDGQPIKDFVWPWIKK